MSELENRLAQEVRQWREKDEKRTEEVRQKSRTNLILSLVLGSSLFTAAVTQVIEIFGNEYKEDVRRCELAIEGLEKLGGAPLKSLPPEDRDRVIGELVEMMDSNCHVQNDLEDTTDGSS